MTTIVVVLGAFCGGFVTGLAGFGTGLTALAFWLHVVDPVAAAALVVTCSVVGQTQSLFAVRRGISWQRAWPFLAGGVIGVPLGAASLQAIAPQALKAILGILLVGYTAVMLGLRRLPVTAWGGKAADGVVGFGGGVLGGLAGLSGPLPTIWCGLRGWTADAQRAVYQPFNLTTLAIVLCTYIAQGTMTPEIWRLALVCAPATILGAFLGIRTYGKVNDRQFRKLVLWLLLASGVVLTVSNLR
jgi:uncharacterized membrane protein YfcA